MFATAAVVDAFRKEERRNELDRQLEEARRELAELKATNSSYDASDHLGAGEELTARQMDKMWTAMKQLYANRPAYDLVYSPPTHTASDFITELKAQQYGCLDRAALEATLVTDYNRLEQQILTEEMDSSLPQRTAKLEVHMERDSERIQRIVRRLMFRTHIMTGGTDKDPPSRAVLELKDLTAKGYPYYKFPDDDPQDAHENTLTLNQNIRASMESKDLTLREKINRICFDLLVSKYPPDIHTHNTLIVAFNKAGHHELAEAMVHSFIRERFLKPSPTTWAAILNHYKCKHNYGSFMQAIASICGSDGVSGGKMGRRHVEDVEKNPRFLKAWAKDNLSRTQIGDWIWEHVPLNRTLLETMFNGLLHFKMFKEASNFFFACLSADILLNKQCVRALFDHCLAALDLQAMGRLLSGMSKPVLWQRMIESLDDETNLYIGRKLLSITNLCGVVRDAEPEDGVRLTSCPLPAQCASLFEFVDQALAPLSKGRTDSLTLNKPEKDCWEPSKTRLLQLEGLWRDYVKIRKTTATIEHRLLKPGRVVLRASLLEHIASSALLNSQRLSGEIESILALSELDINRDMKEANSSATSNDMVEDLPPVDAVEIETKTEDGPRYRTPTPSSSDSGFVVNHWYGKTGPDFRSYHDTISA